MKTVNKKIMRSGLQYIGHFNTARVVLGFDNFELIIRKDKVNDFLCKLYALLEIDPEDGVYVSDLKGQLIRVVFDGDDVVALINILDDEKVLMLKDYIYE